MYEDDRNNYQGSSFTNYDAAEHREPERMDAADALHGGSNAQSGSSNEAYGTGSMQSGSSNAQPGMSGEPFGSSNAQSGGRMPEQAAGAQNAGDGRGAEPMYADRAFSQDNRMNMSHIPQEPRHQLRKKTPMAAKIAGITAAALLFGVVAGATMFGVNTAGEYLKAQYAPETVQEETKTTVAAAEPSGESSVPAAAEVSPAIQTDVSSIVEMAMPSVVAINNTMLVEQQTWFGPNQKVEVPSSGSGIIVGQNDEELLIVTNNHVVEDSKELLVTFIDNEAVSAAIKGTDSESDLAVIAVSLKDIPSDTMSQIKIATLGDSDSLKVGQGVIAIGNALGYGQSVTVGYVSALDREVKTEDGSARNLLQTDAAINPGNSGGALLNMRGEVIGINAAKYSSTSVEGMGYAIPISKAQDIINELMNKRTRIEVEESKQGYLGIQGQNIDETAAAMYGMPRGIYVYKIIEGSAAADSDLREKDIITKFDGQTVRTMADLKSMLTYYEGESTVDLTVQSLENGEYVERTVEITLGFKPAAETN